VQVCAKLFKITVFLIKSKQGLKPNYKTFFYGVITKMSEYQLTQAEFNEKYNQFTHNKNSLSFQNSERIIKQHLTGKKDDEIANNFGVDRTKIAKFIESMYKLFLNEKIDRRKHNPIPDLCKFFLQYKPELISTEIKEKYNLQDDSPSLNSYPSQPETLNSIFYLERGFTDKWFEENVLKNRLIKIKSPHKTGKTSLLMRMINFVTNYNYSVVNLSLLDTDTNVLSNQESFYQWFFSSITEQLDLENTLKDYSQTNCVKFFEKNILKLLNNPLFLVIDDLDKLFLAPDVTENFASLLRSFFNKGSHNQKWTKLHLIIAYSTDCYVELDLNKSPFNVGFPIKLPNLTVSEIQKLAQLYQLNWQENEINNLIKMIGGHPFLIRLTMYYCVKNQLTLSEILKEVTNNYYQNIYSEYLQELAATLENNAQLCVLFKNILKANNQVELTRKEAYLLESLGLITMANNQPNLTCNLYQQYFTQCL
jgi:hypothetical protein